MSFWKGLSRAFTVPRRVRNEVDRSPIIQAAKGLLVMELKGVIAQTIGKHISDPAAAAAVNSEVNSLLNASGIAK